MDINQRLHKASLNPKINKNTIYDTWAKTYDEYIKKQKYTGPNELVEHLYMLIYEREHEDIQYDTMFNKENAKINILDFGCGTGLVGKEIRNKMIIACLDGIDISNKMLTECSKKKCYNKLFNINIQSEDFIGYTEYDYIVSSGVFLEGHVEFTVIPKLLRFLKKYGYIIFTTRVSFLMDNIDVFDKVITNNPDIDIIKCKDINYLSKTKCKLYIIQKV